MDSNKKDKGQNFIPGNDSRPILSVHEKLPKTIEEQIRKKTVKVTLTKQMIEIMKKRGIGENVTFNQFVRELILAIKDKQFYLENYDVLVEILNIMVSGLE